MGLGFNAVSISIVNSECHEAYQAALTANVCCIQPCREMTVDGCTLCQFMERHDVKDFKTLRVDQRDAAPQKFPIAKQSSENSSVFIKFTKKEFEKDAATQQCGVNFTGNLLTYLLLFLPLTGWCLSPAIVWKKKAYRSKFDNEKNYVEFTQLTMRMLHAHTQNNNNNNLNNINNSERNKR